MTNSPKYEIRLPPAERELWEQAAAQEGRTLANWVKYVCAAAARKKETK